MRLQNALNKYKNASILHTLAELINYGQAWPNAGGLVLIKVSADHVCVFFLRHAFVVIYLPRTIIRISFGSIFIFFVYSLTMRCKNINQIAFVVSRIDDLRLQICL